MNIGYIFRSQLLPFPPSRGNDPLGSESGFLAYRDAGKGRKYLSMS